MADLQAKILVISDGAVATGFGRIIHGIFSNLPKDKYEIHHLAAGYKGDPHDLPWKVYAACAGGDIYGINRIKQLMDKIKPELVFCLNDLWVLAECAKILKEYSEKSKVVFYYSLDAGPVDPDWLKGSEFVDRRVSFTNFIKNELQKVLGYDKQVDVIPPGIDYNLFYPFPDNNNESGMIIAKRQLGVFKENEIKDSLIVLNANRNQPRKRIDITIKGFSLFAKDKPANVKLYLHMGFEEFGWNILKLCERYSIGERLICTNNENCLPSVIDSALNIIYNASDIGINTSYFEGWGLPNYEHAATRKAQVVPRITACAEIWNECAVFLEPVTEFVQERTLCEGKLVSPEGVAEALEELYNNIDYRNRIAEACYQRVVKPELSWESIGAKWEQIFQELLDSLP